MSVITSNHYHLVMVCAPGDVNLSGPPALTAFLSLSFCRVHTSAVRRIVVLLLFLSIVHFSSGNNGKVGGPVKVNFREKEKQVLDQILGRYDARIRPSGENGTGQY
ncbi:hypothetical protein ONE63_009528 [Megalurothrips usitatus]|uniref:Neurotransmitter-gated ion-channel ligand-binding domain-containing protein n=1 Tax=Megalurothrips usitatus TaxID=439358 RepID=A0AAV7XRQ5_9NEOP|nr:hypothetical protein ONE63_009528 [Megalurothrips usitatus]